MIRKIRRIWRKIQLYKNPGKGVKSFELALPDIMHTINTTKQARTKLAPNDVLNDLSLSGKNFDAKYAKRLRNNYEGLAVASFPVGTRVRLRPFPGANPFQKVVYICFKYFFIVLVFLHIYFRV